MQVYSREGEDFNKLSEFGHKRRQLLTYFSAGIITALLTACGNNSTAIPTVVANAAGVVTTPITPDTVIPTREVMSETHFAPELEPIVDLRWSAWKTEFVKPAVDGGLRVVNPTSAVYNFYENAKPITNATYSEGMGYGMLFSSFAKDYETLDGLLEYVKNHRVNKNDVTNGDNYLMNWIQDENGVSTNIGSATDGDEDIAFALILAAGDIEDKTKSEEYLAQARLIINSLMKYNVEAGTFILKPGNDWGGTHLVNPSMFGSAWYEAFARVSGDENWLKVRDATQSMLTNLSEKSPEVLGTGLVPDFMQANGESAEPVEAGRGYKHSYDSTRFIPRAVMSKLLNANQPVTDNYLNAFIDFMETKDLRGDEVRDGYELNGDPTVEWVDMAFYAEILAVSIYSDNVEFRKAAIDIYKDEEIESIGSYFEKSLGLWAGFIMDGRLLKFKTN